MKPFPYLEFLVLFHPLLIVLVAGVMLLFFISPGCVRVTHRLPPLPMPQIVTVPSPFLGRCVLVQKLKRQFSDGEIPAELTQAEEICREAGL